jgi:hypothetical protein
LIRLTMFCDLLPYSDTAATELLNDAVMRDGLNRERGGVSYRLIAFIGKVTETRCGIT